MCFSCLGFLGVWRLAFRPAYSPGLPDGDFFRTLYGQGHLPRIDKGARTRVALQLVLKRTNALTGDRRCCRSSRRTTCCLETKARRALPCNQEKPASAWRVQNAGGRAPSLDVHDNYGVTVVYKRIRDGRRQNPA